MATSQIRRSPARAGWDPEAVTVLRLAALAGLVWLLLVLV